MSVVTQLQPSLTRADFMNFWSGRPSADKPVSDFDPAAVISHHIDCCVKGSGCHYGLYEARLLRTLRQEFDSLPRDHRIEFQQALILREIRIDDEAIDEAEQAEAECMAEIHREQA